MSEQGLTEHLIFSVRETVGGFVYVCIIRGVYTLILLLFVRSRNMFMSGRQGGGRSGLCDGCLRHPQEDNARYFVLYLVQYGARC